MRAFKLVFLVGLLALSAIAANAQYYTLNGSGSLNAEGAQPALTGTVTNFAASSTAILPLFSALSADTTHTHVLVRVANGTTVYFNPPSVASKALGLEFTSSDGMFMFPLTDEIKTMTVLGDAGSETLDYMPITQE